jgi:hypothetical protein
MNIYISVADLILDVSYQKPFELILLQQLMRNMVVLMTMCATFISDELPFSLGNSFQHQCKK